MTPILQEDCRALAHDDSLPWDALRGKAVVVSGATGLIGKTLVGAILAREDDVPSGMTVCVLARKPAKALSLFPKSSALSIVSWDAAEARVGLEGITHADVIFHCANMTDSSSFVERPVEVIDTTVDGARAMLELARRTGSSVCLLSTMETYGEVSHEGAVREDQGGFLDTMVVRNSYPEAKRLDEAYAAAYASQYGVDAKVLRLSQTFGPGVPPDDNRVFAYFARCALQKKDIVMLTEGNKQNAYLYTADAVRAALVVAMRGVCGRAYNAANDETFCAVRDMAAMVADVFGAGKISVRFELDAQAAARFRKGSVLRLDTSALRALGWDPQVGLQEMYRRMMRDWEFTQSV